MPNNAIPAMDHPICEDEQTNVSEDDDSILYDSYNPNPFNRMVIGSDDRVTIRDTSAFPYSAIAYMKVHARCGCNWNCTRFMVGPKGMITGAHCLVCSTHHKTADTITFYFGYRSKKKYFYKYNGSFHYWYGTDFSDSGYDSEWDYGYIKLKKRVGDKTQCH